MLLCCLMSVVQMTSVGFALLVPAAINSELSFRSCFKKLCRSLLLSTPSLHWVFTMWSRNKTLEWVHIMNMNQKTMAFTFISLIAAEKQKMLSEAKWNAGKLFAMIFDNGWLFKSLNWRPIVRCTCTLCFSFRGIPTLDWSWLWIVWECVELDFGGKKGGMEKGHSFGKINFSDF